VGNPTWLGRNKKGKMNLLLNDQVQVSIDTRFGLTLITGTIISLGEVLTKPDVYWFQLAGLTSTFYTDDDGLTVKKVG
jgi:hypothetical protein